MFAEMDYCTRNIKRIVVANWWTLNFDKFELNFSIVFNIRNITLFFFLSKSELFGLKTDFIESLLNFDCFNEKVLIFQIACNKINFFLTSN